MSELPAVTRRTVVRAAAWAAPVVVVAVAAPQATASGLACPTGAAATVASALNYVANVSGNKAPLTFANALQIDTSAVDASELNSIGTDDVTSAELTTLRGGILATYTSTSTPSGAITLGTPATIGSLTFAGVDYTSGSYTATSNPVRPTKITATVTLHLETTSGRPLNSCAYALEWSLNAWGIGVVTPSFLGGAGQVNFSIPI